MSTVSPTAACDLLMVHPGLPTGLSLGAGFLVFLLLLRTLRHPHSAPTAPREEGRTLHDFPFLGGLLHRFTRYPAWLATVRFVFAAIFLVVVAAGLWGTPIPERNLATTLTWNVWWTLVILSVLVAGTAWCGVCPWDGLATWMARRRFWQRGDEEDGLGLKVPAPLRSVWPAMAMLAGLTWLELGLGVTVSPAATAHLAVLITILALISQTLFERKAFCRYFCPVGRTLGFYAQLSPLELRPRHQTRCTTCTTLECHHGTREVPPCPTHLTMGRFAQNTYCLSCGACAASCPGDNVVWRLRSMAREAREGARPHWDEAWFMIGLLGLTSFHGVTMLPLWESGLADLARSLGDTRLLLPAFSLGMILFLAAMLLLYALAVAATRALVPAGPEFRRLFSGLAFTALPLAFGYHVAHNLAHLSREGDGLWQVILNPLGQGTLPFTTSERQLRMMESLLPDPVIHLAQTGVVVWGFWLAMLVLRHRGGDLLGEGGVVPGRRLAPMAFFSALATGFNLWLLTRDMVMRF